MRQASGAAARSLRSLVALLPVLDDSLFQYSGSARLEAISEKGMAMPTIRDAVQEQFSAAAASYRTSPVHASGPDLEAIVQIVRRLPAPQVLDIGCGPGHVSINVAPWAAHVVACDLTERMLEQVELFARERQIPNITTRQADVTRLPFADQQFDLVIARYCAHHWPQPLIALSECRRVLRPDGLLLLSDSIAPEEPGLDTFLQTIEYLRDRSHVRNQSISQWCQLCIEAGLTFTLIGNWPIPLEFAPWVQRIGTPAAHVATIR